MAASTRTIVPILSVVALAIAFWMLFLAPKRERSDELGAQAEQLQSKLAQSQSAISSGEEARREFPTNYQQLVVLGKAVPASDESASLLVQLSHVASHAGVKFESLQVGTGEGSEATPAETAPEAAAPEGESESQAAPAGGSEGEGETTTSEAPTGVPTASVAPTEAAASLQPIGALVGPAGLSVLPYDLTFQGSFFHVADFIKGIDSLIHTGGSNVAVDGRLVTLNGFSLSGNAEHGFPDLNADFSVTTYLVPPGQGITAGASPAEPAEVESAESATVSNLR
jgi:Tfp pilus assembly protein PilO